MSGFITERRLAEVAMDGRWSADLAALEARRWPPVASRIHGARLRTGLNEAEVARRLGLTVSSYCDLEGYDDEAFEVISLRDLEALGRVLRVQPRVLLLGSEAEGIMQSITEGEITERLREKVLESGQGVEEFGDAIGWDIKELLADPKTLWSFNVEGLYDLCKPIGVDWVTALPGSGLASL
jgi:transcriptional regulator with XRE-family HTH domain